MPMKVPIVERSVGISPASVPAAPGPVAAPEAAFGTGVAQAEQNLGNTVEGIGKVIADHQTKMAQEMQDKQTFDLATQAFEKYRQAAYDPETDENGVPKGVLLRQGDQAQGAYSAFKSAHEQIVRDTLSQSTNDHQQAALTKLLTEHYYGLEDGVAKHEATERRKSIDVSNEALKEQFKASAGSIQDSGRLLTMMDSASTVAMRGLTLKGIQDPHALSFAAADLRGEMAKNAIFGQPTTEAGMKMLEDVKSRLAPDTYNALKNDLEIQQKREEEQAKAQKSKLWDDTFQNDLSLSFTGQLTLSELQRQYNHGQLGPSHYQSLAHIVADPAFSFLRPGEVSDPATFNAIREAQLTRSKSRSELLQMIGDAFGQRKLVNSITGGNDVQYLTDRAKEIPETPDERRTATQAQSIRDFGNRYLSGSQSWIQQTFKKEDAQKETATKTEAMVQDFLKRVDSTHATGDQIEEIARQVQADHVRNEHPEVGRLDDLPHVILGVDGKVQRVLSPDQHSNIKPNFTIKRNRPAAEPKPKPKAKATEK